MHFAVEFGFGKTSDYHISAYGEDIAHTLANAWVHKVSSFYEAWLAADRPAVMAWAHHVEAYVEPAEVSALVGDAGSLLVRRLAKLRAMWPRR